MNRPSRNRKTLYEILRERDPNHNDINLGFEFAGFVYHSRRSYSPGIMLKNHPVFNPGTVQELQKRFQERVRSSLYVVSTHGDYFPPADKFASNTVEWMVMNLARKGRFEDIGAAVREGAEEYQRRMVERGMRNYLIAAEYRAIARALQERGPH